MGAAAATAERRRIGRFEIVRVLGKGAQGTVYLARDTHLGRNVAVKTLRLDRTDPETRAEHMRTLLEEARIVSKMQHPNIVILHDAGEDQDTPYLVFEYVEGRTLAALLHEKGTLPAAQAADIAVQALRGIGYAHEQSVVHRDLKPANIILTEDGVAQVMDFGIARHVADVTTTEQALFGTPNYMAPEYLASRAFTASSDLFSLGMVLYEMLAGQPAVKMDNMFETMHRMVNEPFPPPNEVNEEVDEKLVGIVMKAIAKNPRDRYESAAKMEEALTAWLEPGSVSTSGTRGTLEFLLRRIRHKSDFPALSATIVTVNQVVALSDRERTSALCNAILKDFALTTKLLKLVNGATYYSQFGGGVSTVSRAVAILGFDGTRDVAMSLMLFEHLQNKAQATALRDEVAATYFSGVLARELMRKMGIRDAEEAFICAMFHRLGRVLVTFYLHEEAQTIARLVQSRRGDEARIATEVLGMSYEELGMGVARKWNFPDNIIGSMRPLMEAPRNRSAFDANKLRALSDLSNGLSDVVRSGTGEARKKGLAALVEKFGGAIDITATDLTEVVQESVKALVSEAEILGFKSRKSPFFDAARSWVPAEGKTAAPDAAETLVGQTQLNVADPTKMFGAGGHVTMSKRQAVLAAGVQDITTTLAVEHDRNDVLRIILETMYRAIGFTRVLLCIHDAAHGTLRSRFGFGADVDELVSSGFAIPLTGSRDIFFAATSQGVDICIDDIDAERIRQHVPSWYRDAVKARGFVLFPIIVNKKPVALIYADANDPAVLRFSPEELSMLKTLRNQAVLVVKQKP